MNTDLRAFMKEELKNKGTMEFPGIEKFKDKDGNPIPLIVKRLSSKEIKEIRNMYKTNKVFRDKQNGNKPVIVNGQVAVIKEYDAEKAGLNILVDALVQPKLDDPELMEYYEVLDKLDMPEIIFFDKEDFKYVNKCVMEACNLMDKKTEKNTLKEIKN